MSVNLEKLFRDNHRWLLTRLRRLTSSIHAAEDAASETFVRLAHRTPDDVQEPRALLTTIAKRVLQDTWRRRDMERAYIEGLAAMPEPVYPSAEQCALVTEALLAIDAALGALPTKVRYAFIYSQLEDKPLTEIAKLLGVSATSVHNYVMRAMLAVVKATDQTGDR